jgi:hypothetical protein
VDLLRQLCQSSAPNSLRLQSGVMKMLFTLNSKSFLMPLRLRRGIVQVMPVEEYFVTGSVRRWVNLLEFIALSDTAFFKCV